MRPGGGIDMRLNAICWAVLFADLSYARAAAPAVSFDAPGALQAFSAADEEVGITTVSGDFNGDGKQDLAVMKSTIITVLPGNGDGTFQPPLGSYPAGNCPGQPYYCGQFYGMVAGDFNGDGKLDLAVGQEVSNSGYGSFGFQIFLGNGDGTFTLLPPVLGPDVPLIAGDFNGDGKLDLAVAGGNTVQIYLGNGDGTFQAEAVYSLPSGTYVAGLATADFNGDGILDLAATNCAAYCQGSSLSILLGNGDGTFQPALTATEALTGCIAAGDFNGDRKTDLALCGPTNEVLIQLGNGDGTFAPSISYPVTGDSGVAIGDFNHDGHLDLAVLNSGLSILLGKGDGEFYPQRFYPSTGGGGILSSMSLADFNGDGYQDVAVGNAFTVSILLNFRGVFQHPTEYAAQKSPRAVAEGDFNLDGKPDMVVANSGANTISVLLGNGNGTFQHTVNYPVGKNPASIVVADLNGDGKPDLAVANSSDATVSILLGVGDGTFQPAVSYTSGGALAVAIGDFNGDGKLDLATANPACPTVCMGTVSVLLGKGDGTFRAPVTSVAGRGIATWLAVADFNRDGKADLAVTLKNTYQVAILLGNGNGTFQAPVDYPVGYFPAVVTTADLNGDGISDLAVANSGSNSISILLGKGDGTFQPQVTYQTGAAQTLAFGDFNGDGKVDVAVSLGDAVSILAGNGDGTFQNGVDFVVGVTDFGLAVGDFNRDGQADLAVADTGHGAVAVLLNTSGRR